MFFQAILLAASIEAGVMSGGIYNYMSPPKKAYDSARVLYTSLDVQAKYGVFYIGGGITTYMSMQDITTYWPWQSDYRIGAGLKIGNMQIGYEHECYHPQYPYLMIFREQFTPKYEGGHDKIFIRITSK